MADEEQKPKGSHFKKIEELLNLDGCAAFDEEQAKTEAEQLEQRRKMVQAAKDKLAELEKKDGDDYSKEVLKQLIAKGMSMLTAFQMDVEDNPCGRDIETAASLMTSINGVVDNINKMKVDNAKISLEQQKLELKKQGLLAGDDGKNITNNQQNNYIFSGTTTEILDFLESNKIIGKNSRPVEKQVIDAKVIKPEENNKNIEEKIVKPEEKNETKIVKPKDSQSTFEGW